MALSRIARQREMLKEMETELARYKQQLAKAETQEICPHTNIKDADVFGSECQDCGKFFDSGF